MNFKRCTFLKLPFMVYEEKGFRYFLSAPDHDSDSLKCHNIAIP